MIIELMITAFLCIFQSYISNLIRTKTGLNKFNWFYSSLFILILITYYLFSPTINLGDISYGIIIGIIVFIILGIPMFVWEVYKNKKVSKPKSIQKEVLETLFIVSPMEEIMFRGIIFSLALPYGILFAIIFQAVIFSVWHMKFDKRFMVTLFISAIVFELLYIFSGSIFTPIVFHAFLNIGEFTVKPFIGNMVKNESATKYSTSKHFIKIFK